jgi:hypothetical protein
MAKLAKEETGVPVLRSGMKNAASRPGHESAFFRIQISNSHTSAISRRHASELCQ